MAVIPSAGGSGSGATGWIKVIDINTGASPVVNKVYQDPPNDTILQSCTISTLDIEIELASSFPLVSVSGSNFTLNQSADGGHYSGTISVTLPADGSVEVTTETPDGKTGAKDTFTVLLETPPSILTLEFTGGYPGSQTELKAGDTFQLIGTTDKNADAIEIQDFGAMVNSIETFVAGQSFTVIGTIADRGTVAQLLSAKARARDATTGSYGSYFDTNNSGAGVDGTNVLNLNNLYPSVSIGAPAYPASQQALKNAEEAQVPVTASDLDSIAFDSPNGDLSITNPSTVEAVKTVQRISGDYNISVNNFRAVATRAANDAKTAAQAVINIANIAAVVNVLPPASRLRSGGNDGTVIQNHTITIQADQHLLNAPSLSEGAGGGAFTGSWTGGPSNWTRFLQVHDNDIKGSYTWTNLIATNLAGIVTSSISGSDIYTLGGFVKRSLTFAAFSQQTSINTEVVDYSKVQAGIFTSTNQPAVKHTPQGDQGDASNEYTILSPLSNNPQTLWWNDATAAGANSGGTAQITNVEEVV